MIFLYVGWYLFADFKVSDYNVSEIKFRKRCFMFIARAEELKRAKAFLGSNDTAMLVYGKRRVGKTRLIKEAISSCSCPVISYQCSSESYEMNLEAFSVELRAVFAEPYLSFQTFYDAFTYLEMRKEKIIVVLDEYGELKKTYDAADSMLQRIIDKLKYSGIKVIVAGSAVSLMKELLDEDNPLFDRFGTVIHLTEFDYYDAALFYPSLSPRDKVAYYAVFGGSPNVLETLDPSLGLEANIENLLLSPDGRVRSFVERSLLQEYGKIGSALTIFQTIGNGKRTYTEIKNKVDPSNTGNLARLLDKFTSNEAIRKVSPINHKDERKRTFYRLSENLLRFYFTYVYPNRSRIEAIGENAVYSSLVKPSLDTYISFRFEEIVASYFSRLARKGTLPGIIDIGTYWYDDKNTHMNGEFDCVLEYDYGYDVYEVKYLKGRMTKEFAEEEKVKIASIKAFKPHRIGFVSIDGFDFSSDVYDLVSGDSLYAAELE